MFEAEEVQSLAKDFGLLDKLDSVNKFKGKDVFEKCTNYIQEFKLLVGSN